MAGRYENLVLASFTLRVLAQARNDRMDREAAR